MKNTKRSAFTIVELVIVIAVIAILSAVLIPTFGAIIKDANIAADQTAASTLTTELHVYLKGNTIDSETDLMAALNDEKLGFTEKKLTPKAAAYGMHFWFDMDNQMIVAKTAEEIEALISERTTASVQNGTALIADGAQPTSADINFRAILGGGFFLIDKGGSSIVELLAKLDAVKDADTYKAIATYELEEGDNDYGLANKILTAVKSTVILSDYGAFYCSGAESYNVYVAMGTQSINTVRYVFDGSSTTKTTGDLPALKGAFTLPNSVLDVTSGALNFTGSATIKVPYDANGIKKVFGPQSTNAVIKGSDNDYRVINVPSPSDGHTADRLVLNDEHNTWVADLSAKLPCVDFEISFDVDATVGADQWNSGNLYMFYGDFKETENQFNIAYGENNTIIPGTSNLITWSSTNKSVADFQSTNGLLTVVANTDPADRDTTITATAVNINGETITKTLNLTMVKPTAATIGGGVFNIPESEDYIWKYSGQNGEINFDVVAIYNDNENWDIAVGTSSLEVGENTVFAYANDKLTLKTNGEGNIFAGIHNFDLTIDGCLSEEVTIDLQDVTNSPVTHKFHYTSEAVGSGVSGQYHYYNYYVGNLDAIKLSDILKLKSGASLGNATLTIRAENATRGDDLRDIESDVSVEVNGKEYSHANYPDGVRFTSLDDVTLKFSGVNDYTTEKIVLEITPDRSGAFRIEIAVVDGNNVTAENISNYVNKALSNNIVLLTDFTVTAGTRFEVGNKTFYGNGFKLDATTFDSQKGRDYVINLNGGTVDNVYISGPVFPTLNFDGNRTSDPYHASGIAAAGTSTIKNSYISHFRQPVRADGTATTVINTVLEGGRLANLVWVNGSLTLTDVTTIQKVVQSGTTNVIGAGIYGGPDDVAGLIDDSTSNTLNASLTINGSFVQHNWMSTDMTSAMPDITIAVQDNVIASYPVGAYFSNIIVNKDNYYAAYQSMIHIEDGTNTKYMNGGIMFLKAGLRSGADADWASLTRTVGITDNRTNTNKKRFADISETRTKSKEIACLGTITVDVKAQVYSYSKYTDEANTQEIKLTTSDLNYSGRYVNYGSN